MRLLSALVVVCATAFTQSCGDCSRVVDRAVSPDRRYVAWVDVDDGCLGALSGSRTDVMIVRQSWLFPSRVNALAVRRGVRARLHWKDSHNLEVTLHPWDGIDYSVRHYVPRWKDITVTYVVKPTPLSRDPTSP
jgi:hypothetical protein